MRNRLREVLRFVARSGKRVAVTIAGGILVLAGLAMLVLPGPGLLVIIGGLAVLASEYAWARHLMDRAKEQARKAKDRTKRGAGAVRRKLTGRSRGRRA